MKRWVLTGDLYIRVYESGIILMLVTECYAAFSLIESVTLRSDGTVEHRPSFLPTSHPTRVVR